MRSVAFIALLILGVACEQRVTECGPATGLVPTPSDASLTGAPLGPLLVRGAYGDDATTAVITGYAERTPTKVLFLVAHDMDGAISITGHRCEDGTPLRFWYGRGPAPYVGQSPPAASVFASIGEERETLPVTRTGSAIGGYILFPTAAKYVMDAWSGDRRIGTAVLVVTTAPYPTARPNDACVPTRSTQYAGADGVAHIAKQDGGVIVLTGSDGPFVAGEPQKLAIVLAHRRPNEAYAIEATARERRTGTATAFETHTMLAGLAPDGFAYSGAVVFPVPGCWEIIVNDALGRGIVVLEVVPKR